MCLGSGSANLVSYSFFSSYIPRSGYIQYQYKEVTTPPGGAPEVWEETLLTGIRISVRQSGVCGPPSRSLGRIEPSWCIHNPP